MRCAEMAAVNVTEFRQKLPTYLERARRGERIRVTSRGRVVAELSPPSSTAEEAALARRRLRGSVTRYEEPLEPIIQLGEWDANR
jgi:prevent-host-death family protein